MALVGLAFSMGLTVMTVAPAEPCATPQRAARTFLDNLQLHQQRPDLAARCAQSPPGMNADELKQRVQDLKTVFDSAGYRIAVEHLPDRSDHIDPESGLAVVILHQALPDVVLAHDDVGWRFPARVIEAVPDLVAETFVLDLSGVARRLPGWMRTPVLGVAPWQAGYLALLILLGVLLRVLVAWFVAGWARRVMERLRVPWGRDLLGLASQPLGTLALAGVLALGVPAARLPVGLAAVFGLGIRLLAALALVMVLYRIVDLFGAFLADRAQTTETKLDDQLVPLLRKGLKVMVVAMGAVFVLQNLDVDVGSLLAGLGLGGLAFALAAKDTVANLFGSVTIFLDKPFQIGDWVVMSGVEGIVEEVGFRSTRVRTFYNSLVSVPNAKIVDAIVDNYGRRRYRRTFATLGVTYDTTPQQIEAFCDGIRAILKAHPLTRKDYYEIHFTGYGEFSLNIMLYFFFEVPSWTDELRARHEVYLDIHRLAERLGISFAFPTRTLHVDRHATAEARPLHPAPGTDELKREVEAFAPGGEAVVAPGPRLTHGYYAGGLDDRTKSAEKEVLAPG